MRRSKSGCSKCIIYPLIQNVYRLEVFNRQEQEKEIANNSWQNFALDFYTTKAAAAPYALKVITIASCFWRENEKRSAVMLLLPFTEFSFHVKDYYFFPFNLLTTDLSLRVYSSIVGSSRLTWLCVNSMLFTHDSTGEKG